jgi:hypothetical protein
MAAKRVGLSAHALELRIAGQIGRAESNIWWGKALGEGWQRQWRVMVKIAGDGEVSPFRGNGPVDGREVNGPVEGERGAETGNRGKGGGKGDLVLAKPFTNALRCQALQHWCYMNTV